MKSSLGTGLRDVVFFIARLGLGSVFVAHGWQKFDEYGLEGTTAAFDAMGIPAPKAAALCATAIELGGGVLLLLGLLTPLVGLLLAADMAGAWWFAHKGNGVFIEAGGHELVLALGVGALLCVATGAGRISLDGFLGKSRVADAQETEPAPTEVSV